MGRGRERNQEQLCVWLYSGTVRLVVIIMNINTILIGLIMLLIITAAMISEPINYNNEINNDNNEC